ncbi:MAG: YceD family protein [Castellaniella sp.]|uniref:YceD family protein n=1 Tax=Castellaniella sp. TaxID=1955812 RepID=UPI003C724B77
MVVDALAFSYAGRVLEGSRKAGEFARLCQGLSAPQDADISWRVAGRQDAGTGRLWLDIQAQGTVTLTCQRCLGPFVMSLQVSNTIGLVKDQAQLDALDALEVTGEGSDIEYLVADRQLDILALVEDELILGLPYAPRHDVCPGAAADPEHQDVAKPSPFAVLEQLRK